MDKLLNPAQDRDKLPPERTNGWVRVLDPQTGKFVCEFNPKHDRLVLYNRSRRIVIDLGQYRETGSE